MRSNKLLQVGYVSAAHGLDGSVYIRLSGSGLDWFDQVESFTLRKSGMEPLTLPIQQMKEFKQGLLVKLGSIENRSDSEKLKGFGCFINASLLQSSDDEFYLHQLEGFEVEDLSAGPQGRVNGFFSLGPSDYLKLSNGSISRIMHLF